MGDYSGVNRVDAAIALPLDFCLRQAWVTLGPPADKSGVSRAGIRVNDARPVEFVTAPLRVCTIRPPAGKIEPCARHSLVRCRRDRAIGLRCRAL